MKKFSIILSIITLISLKPVLLSAKISAILKLDRNQATLTDSVELVVTISGTRHANSEPVIKGLKDFTVTPGGTSSRVEFINGNISASMDYTYFIQPQKVGTFQIGPAEFILKGKTHKSNAAKLQIVQTTRGKQSAASAIFLQAALSTTSVYVEEQAIYTLKLYLRKNVRDIGLNLPDVENLVFKQLGKPVEYRSTHDGQNYQVLEVRYAVVPSKAGAYPVGPAKMSMTVLEPRRRSNRSLFNDPFFKDPFSSFSTGRPMTVASQKLSLNVRPLPEEGKPPNFSGLVGNFEIESKLEPVALKAGESATLTVSVSGRGNVNRIPDLKIPELDRVKVYADQPQLQTTQNSDGLGGLKNMKWALVPENEGPLEIPPLSISFFDTQNHTYKTLKTSKYSLSVQPGKKAPIADSSMLAVNSGSENSAKQAVKELGRDIFPVHTTMKDFEATNSLFLETWLLTAVLGFPILIYVGTLCGVRIRRQTLNARADIRAKKATREFNKQFRKGELTYSELLQVIREFLNDRFGLAYGELTSQEAFEILRSNGVGADTAEKFQISMQQLENAAYTGKGQITVSIGKDLPRLIKKIEKESR